jgi:tRNA dimethylallyltransferase
MKKLLVICGPTATGKTRLALQLAKLLNGEVVSADSRQVYKGMDIGTGKDLPSSAKFKVPRPRQAKRGGQSSKLGGYYEVDGVKIWGYDLVHPKEEFSVAQYVRIVKSIIENIWKKRKLPILIGGTGLYIEGVIDGISTAGVPKNEALRKSLEAKNPGELFEMLAQLDPVRAASMNKSDRGNPRRLIRAIEVADTKVRVRGRVRHREKDSDSDVLFVGLVAPKKDLFRRIEKRVDDRMRQGFEGELKALFKEGVSWEDQSMTSLGYREWRGYVEGVKSKDEATKDWKGAEKQYAGRQITWFKRDSRINWFDSSKKNYKKSVEKLVKKWYSS